ncbi:replication protein [Leuconostoc suionicum]|uniref:replication protein n=1 Tax=Leuconostoc suionicum TaxID=1511761 RepID=UPI0024ACFFFC|nr:replication protein [Leuconostoc suionicum]MDI6545795.1 replication protein [Leuconostoc suionicum]
MENKTKTDWTLSRENINPKTKHPYKRGRNWGIVVYPDSLPKNWKEIISTEPVAISPLHDKDVNPDGEKKKPHYHLVLNYKGNKSFEQIDEIARALKAPIPQRISSLTGAVRYLTHMDNPEKYQYDSSLIETYGGFDLESCLALSTGDKRQALRDMLAFISENEIMHLKDFADYCMSEEAPAGWFELLTERNTLFIKEYIKSNWQKEQYSKEMGQKR